MGCRWMDRSNMHERTDERARRSAGMRIKGKDLRLEEGPLVKALNQGNRALGDFGVLRSKIYIGSYSIFS